MTQVQPQPQPCRIRTVNVMLTQTCALRHNVYGLRSIKSPTWMKRYHHVKIFIRLPADISKKTILRPIYWFVSHAHSYFLKNCALCKTDCFFFLIGVREEEGQRRGARKLEAGGGKEDGEEGEEVTIKLRKCI